LNPVSHRVTGNAKGALHHASDLSRLAGTAKSGAEIARRCRWISIGETVGILALILSGVSLWDSHRERAETRAAASHKPMTKVAPLVLAATADAIGETLYDIGHGWRSRLLHRDVPVLQAIRLVSSISMADRVQARIDTRWTRLDVAKD